jgi:hypothetical protein
LYFLKKDGTTCAILASENCCTKALALLLTNKADVHVADRVLIILR